MAARSSVKSLSVVGLLMVLAVVIFVGMVFFNKKSVVMGFEDVAVSMCEEGVKPCPEGFFCQSKSCVPIYPKANIDAVNGF
jgi:hypothetical protein